MEDTLPEQESTDTAPEDADTNEEESPEAQAKPAFVINFYSWTTPIIGLVMLIVGLAGGYFGRPLLERKSAAAPAAATVSTPSASQEQNPNAEALMAQVVASTRHFKGNPNAPVTIVEYSDYQ